MSFKKNVFGHWTKKWICGYCHPINQKIKSNRYALPLPKKLFHAIGFSCISNTLDLHSSYHQLPLVVKDWVKARFWGVDHDDKNQLYQWKFLSLDLKNIPNVLED